MNVNHKALKKIVKIWKKHPFPKPLLVFCIAVILIGYHIGAFFRRHRRTILSICGIVFVLAGSDYCNYMKRVTKEDNLAQKAETHALANDIQETETETISSVILNEEEVNEVLDRLLQEEGAEEKIYDSYYIRINRLKNCVTIYTRDEAGEYTVPVKVMICSTGGMNTPLGVYTLGKRSEFENLLFQVYGQYATNIVGQILFHSVSYNQPRKDCLIAEEFNSLGEGVSHGCIRLTVGDAKWIYEHCMEGTVVEIYDSEIPGPLGKPKMLKIPEGTLWDPTDDSAENPWKDCKPVIKGVADREIPLGTSISYLYGVSAKDTCGNNVTADIRVYGEVNVNQKGKYMVIYYIKDLIGRTDLRTAIYTVR